MHDVLLFVAILGLLTSSVYVVMVLLAAQRFRRTRAVAAEACLPPVTLLKPLHGMEPQLRRDLESFFQQDYPQFEIVVGVRHANDPALMVVRELAARYPQVPVRTVLSGDPQWPNAKVYSLQQMLAAAAHDVLVISDSDVQAPREYLRAVAAPLADPAVGLVTCIYRGQHGGGVWSRLEALGMSVELTSGVLVADMLEGMKFALGPTMATRRDCLQKIGGFAALADYHADDFVLGNRIHAAGYEVVLSHQIIGHSIVNRSLMSSLQHQVLWAKSTRRSRPKGHLGTGLTFALPYALLGAATMLAAGRPLAAGVMLAAGWANRMLQSIVVGWGVVRDRDALRYSWAYPLRDLLGFFYWASSFFGSNRTVWRGEGYRFGPGGKLIRLAPVRELARSESRS